MTPKERAKRSAKQMWENDKASKWLGLDLISVDEGRAVFAMEVKEHHANGHGICHGGFIFTLADTAFAFACNSRNQSTVAQHNSISYLAPAQIGDTLTAVAQEIDLSGRSGITDVEVLDQNNKKIAVFRGASRAIKGQLFSEG